MKNDVSILRVLQSALLQVARFVLRPAPKAGVALVLALALFTGPDAQ